MPPKLHKLSIPFMGSSNDTSAPILPSTQQDLTAEPAQLDTPAGPRPSAARTHSLQNAFPTFLRSPNTPQTLGSVPLTSPNAGSSSPAINTPLSPGRHRAHTVSVSLGPRPVRRGSALTALAADNGSRNSKEDSRNSRERRRSRDRSRSITRSDMREREGSPVRFEMGTKRNHVDLNDEVVGMLDCIDPQVSTVNHLQNVSNGLIFPHLPSLWSRRPEIVIPHSSSDEEIQPLTATDEAPQTATTATTRTPGRRRATTSARARSNTVSKLFPSTPTTSTSASYPFPPSAGEPTSAPTTGGFQPIPESPHAVPRTITEDELDADVEEIEKDGDLDAHVRKILHKRSKKEFIKNSLKGLWTFVKTPMGFVTAIYGFLVVFWGAGLVIILAGWIPMNSKNTQDVWVEICSQILNGLFTVTGIGLIPWRVTDTFRMVIIWKSKRMIHKRRQEQDLPPIPDENDLPDPKDSADYISVLTEQEQADLLTHQIAFSKSQTWYYPHATATHKAFPISWALWNTVLMDGNSFFQCFLCGCMWGLNRHQRPAWTTGTLIPLSFLCGIFAGVLIWQGSVRTKKRVTVEDKLRAALGVPLAIGGIPQTKDGTVVTSGNRAPTPPTPGSPNTSESGGSKGADETRESARMLEKRRSPRRTSITIGNVTDPLEGAETGRTRGHTVAVPGQTGTRETLGGMEPQLVKSQPKVAEKGQ